MEVTSSVLVDMARAKPKSHSFTTPAGCSTSFLTQLHLRLKSLCTTILDTSTCTHALLYRAARSPVRKSRALHFSDAEEGRFRVHRKRTVGADQDVLGLHVPVDDAMHVQVAQCFHELPCYRAHFSLRQLPIVLKHFKQLAYAGMQCLFLERNQTQDG